jgi:hypothetical protein
MTRERESQAGKQDDFPSAVAHRRPWGIDFPEAPPKDESKRTP